MNDFDVLDDFDRRLDPLVPDARAPLALLVTQGRVGRRRRAAVRAGVGAAAAVTLVAALGVVLDRTGTSESATMTSPAAPTAAVRPVGFGGLVIDVPAEWTQVCGSSSNGALVLGTIASSTHEPCGRGRIALAHDVGRYVGRQDDYTLNDLVVRSVDPCPRGFCTDVASMFVRDESVLVTVSGLPEPELEEFMATLRPMPDDMTAVPPLQQFQDAGQVCSELAEAGLIGSTNLLCDSEFMVDVTHAQPTPGSVVPTGSAVEITVSPW